MLSKEEFIEEALKYINFPATTYTNPNKGCKPSGFDCSGFIYFVLQQSKYPEYIPRHANELFDSFGILIHEKFADIGDLVFFSDKKGIYPSHVGILTSPNNYIHSPGINGKHVKISRLRKKRIRDSGDRKQIYEYRLIGIKRITIKRERYNIPFLQ